MLTLNQLLIISRTEQPVNLNLTEVFITELRETKINLLARDQAIELVVNLQEVAVLEVLLLPEGLVVVLEVLLLPEGLEVVPEVLLLQEGLEAVPGAAPRGAQKVAVLLPVQNQEEVLKKDQDSIYYHL
ncbi:MAG: hypothetical protein ACI8VT_000771 [Saprospiraceae bacterium]|jgi:hypothetical protein